MSGNPYQSPQSTDAAARQKSNSIRATTHGDLLRVEWKNRGQQPFLWVVFVLFSLIWIPATLFVTAVMFYGVVWLRQFQWGVFIWLIFAWFGVYLTYHTLVSWFGTEWIELSPRGMVAGHSGWLVSRAKSYSLDDIEEVAVGRYYSNVSEWNVMLGIVRKSVPGWQKTRTVGYWLPIEFKREVFQHLNSHAQKHSIPITLTNYFLLPEQSRSVWRRHGFGPGGLRVKQEKKQGEKSPPASKP